MDNLICGFGIKHKFTENDYSLTYVTEPRDGFPATLVKVQKSEHPSAAECDAFQNEFELLTYIHQQFPRQKAIHLDSPTASELAGAHQNAPNIIKIYALESHQQAKVLLLEDIGGKPLSYHIEEKCFSLPEVLSLALKMTVGLAHIHACHIFHKHLNLHNFVWNSKTDELRIVDFSQASRFQTDSPSYLSFSLHQATYAYMSPEQIGRMNRSIDYRSDFYSLGICIYQLLLGRLPFDIEDSNETIYALVSHQPRSPGMINPSIPAPISAIVMKLLNKSPDQRYQSAQSLKNDLQYCLDHFDVLDKKFDFIPAKGDISEYFNIPQNLYGRENEIALLRNSLERIAKQIPKQQLPQQKAEMILVSGYSGIGKSALVREICLPLADKHGYFISGKHDQFQRNIPYSALLSGFARLIQQLLAETEENLHIWRENIQHALGNNGQIIVDVLPEIELIIGKQKSLTHLGTSESQNRFNMVLQKFIKVFCHSDHPLVIFLDDLQWVDRATLKLLELLMEQSEGAPLLIIGAYRDNEISSTHPLMIMLDNLHTLNHNVNEIKLRSLPPLHVGQLIADSLHQNLQTVKPLTKLAIEKTAGNPFFVNQFLHTLHEEGLFKFRLAENAAYSGWYWHIEEIKQLQIAANVVELMISKLRKLPQAAQNMIQLAACIGNQFELNTLSIISQQSISTCYQDLMPILTRGLIKVTEELKIGATRFRHFFFLHDRVQQAAYALITKEEKKRVHLQISRLLLKNITSEATLDEHIFALLEQYNQCYQLVETQKERNKIARLNLVAGRKAKTASAYDAAANYLNVGFECLSADSWHSQYSLTIALAGESVEVEYLNTNYENAESMAEQIIRHANTMLDKSKVYEIQIHAYIAQNKMQQALDLGLNVLHLLGISLIENLPNIDNIEQLVNLPEMHQEDQLAAMRILNAVASAAYLASPDTYPKICYTSIKMCMEYGNSRLAPNAYAVMSLICCGMLGDLDRGYRFSQVAEKVMRDYDAWEIEAKVVLISHACVIHWLKPLRSSLEPLHDATYRALENGDVEYACYAAIYYCIYSFQCGMTLDEVRFRFDKYIALMRSLKQQYQTRYSEIWAQLVDNLSKPCEDPVQLNGDFFNEEKNLPELLQSQYTSSLFCAYYAKVQLAYILRNYSAALKNIELASRYLNGALALNHFATYHFYSSLVYLALYPQVSSQQQQEFIKIVEKNQRLLKHRSEYATANFQHKLALVEAEKARVLGSLEAVEWYEKAIQGAQDYAYIQDEALAYELAAEFYLSRDMGKFAKAYLLEAHYAYQQWGARVKVIALEKQYPQLFTRSTEMEGAGEFNNPVLSCRLDSTTWMDLNCVMKAYETLSEEIVLSGLLEKMMHLVIENAGAEKGFLLLPKQQQWYIEAQSSVNSRNIKILQSIPLNECEQLSQTIVNDVSRSKEYIVLGNACERGAYRQETYIGNNQIRSVLCIPLLKQGNLSAILYLENNLAEEVFTRDRVDLLVVLSSQLAVSIENSLLYNQLQEEIQQHKQTNEELHLTLESLQQTQVQLIYSEKMAALGDLVAGIAHEINTPIGIGVTAVSHLEQQVHKMKQLLESDQLTRSIFTEFTEDAAQTTSIVHSNLNRAADLIRSFKSVAVDQSCEQERSFNLHQYIHEVLTSLRPKLKLTQHVIKVKCPPDLEIYSQPGAFSQIITNLVMNSLLHAYDENVYGILKIDVYINNSVVHFIYSDDGKGMDEFTRQKAFEPFFTTRRQMGGSGLGMHIVYNLVSHALKGQITCESQLGKGTTFVLTLPIKTSV